MGRDKGKGKRGGHRGGRGFAAQSAEEIEQRNRRLAEFDAQRAQRRAEADAEDGGGGGDANAEREAMIAGMGRANLNDSDDDGGEYVQKERKAKGLEGIIETENANRAPVKNMKISDMGGGEERPMTRKEREEKEKAAKAAAYRKRHEAGLTEEYKRDMAKLAEVKARRAAAEEKKKAETEAAKLAEEERKKKAEMSGAFIDSDSDSDSDDDKKKKKKKKSSKKKGGDGGCDAPKLDKITIKKMKPAQLKEALKERGLDIQGNAKTLTARLLDFESKR